MARTLSEIPRRTSATAAMILAALFATPLAAQTAPAEAQPAATPVIVPNPFAAGASPPAPILQKPVVQQSAPARRHELVYRNPFAAGAALPPIQTPLLPGPMSRWQRSLSPLDEPSPVKNAILSADPIDPIHIPWDQLPPVETLRERAALRDHGHAAKASGDFATPPDPLRFSATPLAQPAWLAADAQPLNNLSPIMKASSDQPLHGIPQASWATGPAESSQSLHEIDPLVISDIDDSPASWLAQAEQAAKNAQSMNDFAAVAELCQRGLAAGPPAELSASLRRLAAWAHNRRGELLADDGREHQAIEAFQTALALDADCSLAIHNRAVTLAQQKQFSAALRDFNRVIELNPGLAVAYRNRAELLAALGRMNEAIADYTRAIEGLPEDAELYAARGHAWQRLGSFDRAEADFDRAIEIAPDLPEPLTHRGNLAADRGDYARALADFQQAIAIDPNYAEAYRSLAWLSATCADARFRDARQALAAARKAAQLSAPGDYLVLDALAAAHAAAAQFDEAARIQERAIAAAPPDLADPLRHRLALYKAGQPFHTNSSPRRSPQPRSR